ncbi:MAG TPA: adenylate/guanylate cyclase domain-containing protein [Dehalococcoidia bacterium]|nr:adenylate/guanylate cyclase domain-containing protein [Dehalococcoidia bacterium]
MECEVRYCTTSDGVRIAYCVRGHGPALLSIPYFVESFSLLDLVSGDRELWQQLGRNRTVVQYDVRGTGLSDRGVQDLSHEALIRDVEAVAAAARLETFSVMTSVLGGPTAIAFAARHRDRLSSLVLMGTFARGAGVLPRETILAVLALTRANWDLAASTLVGMASSREGAPDQNPIEVRVVRDSADGETAARFVESAYNADVSALLPEISVPVLVAHRMSDKLVPLGLAQEMAAALPQSRFVPLNTMSYTGPKDAPAVAQLIDSFLRESEAQPDTSARVEAPPVPFRAVLFTDIVEHTRMMYRLGDERGRQVLREHERITREVLKAHGGTEVKTMGDGFMASFGSVTRAVECAIALQRAFDERNTAADPHQEEPFQVRVGLNAGEPIEEEAPDGRNDLFGATVVLAARMAAKAEGGEILVPETVRGLVSGKGFLFSDRGEFVAKGFEEPVRLFEVRWRE